MAFTATMAGIGAASALANTAINATRSNATAENNQGLQLQALQDARNNARNQALVQAMINQRGVAGQTDQYGSSLTYDPATNTWKSTLGALPQGAQTAAMQAAISRNTTDQRQSQDANASAARRATEAEPLADSARRQLADYRPMPSEELIGLLGQQATMAQNETYRPLIADTLRQFARTGTSAGPVLGQIGKDEATTLRQGLIDAQIKGMTSVGDINSQKLKDLQSNAATTSSLATPQFQYTAISPSGVDNTLATLTAQRAQSASMTPAYGMGGATNANTAAAGAAGKAGSAIIGADSANFGKNALGTLATDINTGTGKGGAYTNLANALQGTDLFSSKPDRLPLGQSDPYNTGGTTKNPYTQSTDSGWFTTSDDGGW